LIAAVTWGEGWHNNHHAHPRSARHGLAWYEFDINWIMIRLFEKVGLLSNVYAYDINAKKVENVDNTELQPIQEAA
jgi:stearoyl-CoA desaturase (delta-9 desaturase)